MTVNEKLDLWHFEKLYDLSPKVSVVRNIPTGRLMIYHVSSAENYPVMRDISALDHKNLMSVYDAVIDGGRCLSLCEYIDGMTLEDSVERFSPYSRQDARSIMIQVCGALGELHSHGIVHRDVNPSNIMISRDGIVKLIDFDITREEKPGSAKDTRILGTLGYASPEQFGFAQTDARADVYSCGVLLNYLLTGCLPDEKLYEGKLSGVIKTCMEIDRKKRFESVAQLAEVLKGNRYSKERRFGPLPGFRGKNPVPKVIMSLLIAVYFLFFIFYIIGTTVNGGIDSGAFGGRRENLTFAIAVFGFWSLFPYIFFGNMFNLAYRIYPKNESVGRKITILLGILCIIIGFRMIRMTF